MGNRLRLEGDHSDLHAGCAAVFSALRRIAREKGWTIVGPDSEYDALVMNGEGSMHHGSTGFHKKMHALRTTLDAGKPAWLINTVWQENPPDYDDVLRHLAGISVRENRSRDDLSARHGITARVIPDASMAAKLPRLVLPKQFRDRPVLTDFYWRDNNAFRRADELFPEAEYLRFKKVSWGKAVASFKTASYLITGRQHAVYAACKARVPFAASEGNTHKIKGLIESAGANIPVADSPEKIRGIIPMIPELTDEYEKLFNWLDRQDYASVIPSSNAI